MLHTHDYVLMWHMIMCSCEWAHNSHVLVDIMLHMWVVCYTDIHLHNHSVTQTWSCAHVSERKTVRCKSIWCCTCELCCRCESTRCCTCDLCCACECIRDVDVARVSCVAHVSVYVMLHTLVMLRVWVMSHMWIDMTLHEWVVLQMWVYIWRCTYELCCRCECMYDAAHVSRHDMWVNLMVHLWLVFHGMLWVNMPLHL